jgi:oxygen-independent coproporphyrinogen-3 oxidase
LAGVYLSYPFCAQKCTFCNFASGVFPRALEQQYLDALRAEVSRFDWPWRPETVYLGGGTPSRIPELSLAELLAAIPGGPWKEATLEAAPGTVTPEKARAWRAAGLNRVSLGVQSFVQAEIAGTGRRHTAETVVEEVKLLRDADLANFNIDLIAGLPGQTAESWRESLDWVERLAAPHVSVYMLEIDEDSRLGSEIRIGGARYGAQRVPCEDRVVDLYESAVDRLQELDIPRYEISNFARPGCQSLHNLKYWRLEPYVGFGADAHSFDGATRRRNAESPQEYLARAAAPCVEETAAFPAQERFFLGLRLRAGIRPEPEEWLQFQQPIARFLADGLLETADGILRLTRRGVLLSNEVFREFVL